MQPAYFMHLLRARKTTVLLWSAVLLSLAALVGCLALFPSLPKEDAADAAFVRQVVPILYGRKVRGYDEVKLLTDVITQSNRATLVRSLMESNEFTDHWTEVLIDDLRIGRNGEPLAQPACFGAPLRAAADPALALSIVNNIPQSTSPGGAFNMTDVVRSAIKADNLYPIYRANVYTLMNAIPLASDELQRRERIGARFTEIFLNRQLGCLVCHNSEFSLSGAPSGWNRTHPIRGYFEKALFNASTGEPPNNAFAMFRTDVRFGASAIAPWGLQGCGSYKTTLTTDSENITPIFVTNQSKQFGVHDVQGILQFGYLDLKNNGLQRTLPAAVQATCNFCSANCQGTSIDVTQVANNAPNAATVKTMLISSCQGCHGGAAGLLITNGNDWANDLILQNSSQMPGKKLVQPGDANNSYLINKLTGSGISGSQMPLGSPALSNTQINQVRAWINGMATQTACADCAVTDCSQTRHEVAGHEAFAYLVAARVVDNVWQESMGYPLTIANYFPRNVGQQQVLWNLTEYKFLPRDWSLKDLLVRILTSDFFNRVPPKTSAAATAYVLPPVFDPWTEADPRVSPVSDSGYDPNAHPENHKNAMSEGVRRHTARTLTFSVHKALGWPQPQRTPSAGTYPDTNLMRAIGYYFSDEQPGFQTVDFQGLLAWETVHGTCTKPSGVAVDWIDKLGTAISGFTLTPPDGPLTVGDVGIALRDWILGHGALGNAAPVGLSATEEEALRTIFGVASLSDPVSGVSGLSGKLRTACGIYLESPQFQLAGIEPAGFGPKPRLRVCNTPDCTYKQMCQVLAPNIVKHSPPKSVVLCGDDSISVVQIRLPDLPILVDLCPAGLCGRIPELIQPICDPFGGIRPGGGPGGGPRGVPGGANTPSLTPVPGAAAGAGLPPLEPRACTLQPPRCDPRCNGLHCCGDPGPLRNQIGNRDLLVAWADGAEITQSEGVLIRPRDKTTYELLRRGYKVQVGDLLALQPGNRFEMRTRDGKLMRTPAKGYDKNDAQPNVFVMISGEQALQAPAADPQRAAALAKYQRERTLRIRNSAPWALAGEGGTPLTPERRQSFQYREQELSIDDLRKRGLLTPQIEKAMKEQTAQQPR
jgi:hypothetical protein